MRAYPSQTKLKQIIQYHEAGYFTWKVNGDAGSARNRIGKKVGCLRLMKSGRYEYPIIIDGIKYAGSKITWIYHVGEIPKGYSVFNKKFTEASCRIEDLYLDKNGLNSCVYESKNGGSIYKGVYIRNDVNSGTFRVEFENITIGTFYNEIAAAAAYDFYAKKKYGDEAIINGVDFDCFEKCRVKSNNLNISKTSRGRQSQFIGVSKRVSPIKGNVSYTVKCRKKHIGGFSNETEAARAYNIAAYEHYGEHAVLNDIPDPLGKGDAF